MSALPFLALSLGTLMGALLGLRFNVWALLACLCATVPAMIGTMLLSSCSLTSTMLTTFLVVTSIEVGYLGGAYAGQAGVLRRASRLAPTNR